MKVFITGGTGYIGGEVLYQLLNKFPKFKIKALYRKEGEDLILKNQINNKFNNITPIFGTLNDFKLIERECNEADIIINAANYNHLPSIKIIKQVLIKKRSKTLFLHIGGTGILVNSDINKVYDDIKDIEEINNLPESQPHRPVDKLILSIEEENAKFIKTSIICPPLIFGIGNGCDNKLSVQIPFLIENFINLGFNFMVNNGQYKWDHAHIFDVGSLFIKIIDNFYNNKEFLSGRRGYYFVEDGNDFTWKDLTINIVKSLKKFNLIKTEEIRELNSSQFKELFGISSIYWGSNCRSKSSAGRSIGWEPIKSNDEYFWNDIDVTIKYMVDNKMIE